MNQKLKMGDRVKVIKTEPDYIRHIGKVGKIEAFWVDDSWTVRMNQGDVVIATKVQKLPVKKVIAKKKGKDMRKKYRTIREMRVGDILVRSDGSHPSEVIEIFKNCFVYMNGGDCYIKYFHYAEQEGWTIKGETPPPKTWNFEGKQMTKEEIEEELKK